MTLDEFTIKFLQFVEKSIEPKKDDGYPVCPYARSARMKQTLQFIDAREDLTTFESFDTLLVQEQVDILLRILRIVCLYNVKMIY